MSKKDESVTIEDILELEARIASAARRYLVWFLELSPLDMAKHAVNANDKADKSIRCITALEGSKSEVTWRGGLAKKPKEMSLEIYQREREEAEKRLKSILIQKKEVQIEAAEEAVRELIRKEESN